MSLTLSGTAIPYISPSATVTPMAYSTVLATQMAYPSSTATESSSQWSVSPTEWSVSPYEWSASPSQWPVSPSQWSISPSQWPVSSSPFPTKSMTCVGSKLPGYIILVDQEYFIYGGIILIIACICALAHMTNLHNKNQRLKRLLSSRDRPDTHSHVNTLFTAISNRQV